MSTAARDAIPIFLSFSKPVFPAQKEFVRALSEGLASFGIKPRTLGVTTYDIGVPLTAIAQLMRRSAGLISISFRRVHIQSGEKFNDEDGRPGAKEQISDRWLTSPWPHIEVGMAFQIDLPILILRESGVVADGVLEKGSSAFYLPTFDLSNNTQSYLEGDEWQHIFHQFYRQVQEHLKARPIPYLPNEAPQPWPRILGVADLQRSPDAPASTTGVRDPHHNIPSTSTPVTTPISSKPDPQSGILVRTCCKCKRMAYPESLVYTEIGPTHRLVCPTCDHMKCGDCKIWKVSEPSGAIRSWRFKSIHDINSQVR